MRIRSTLVILAAASALVACQAERTPPAPGTAAGSAPESQLEAAARASAGAGCPVTTQGPARIVTRGEGPVVLHTGPGAGSAAQPNVVLPAGGTDGCPEPQSGTAVPPAPATRSPTRR